MKNTLIALFVLSAYAVASEQDYQDEQLIHLKETTMTNKNDLLEIQFEEFRDMAIWVDLAAEWNMDRIEQLMKRLPPPLERLTVGDLVDAIKDVNENF